jgi:hypothetical protein
MDGCDMAAPVSLPKMIFKRLGSKILVFFGNEGKLEV